METNKQGITVVIPIYNEEEAVEKVISNLKMVLDKYNGLNYEIIAIDDGSKDKTVDIISRLGIKMICHPKNLGYGKSIITGIENSAYDRIAIIDADCTYNAADFINMIPLMETFDMVIGVRNMVEVKEHFIVKLLKLMLRAIIYYFTGCQSLDPNSGIRIFKKNIYKEGKAQFCQKFSFTTSLTFYAHLTNKFLEYVPVRYYPRTGFSKVRHVRDSIRTLFLIISMSLIHRPLRFFIAHIILTIIGFLLIIGVSLLVRQNILFETCLMWSMVMLFASLGYISFILSQIYESLQKK